MIGVMLGGDKARAQYVTRGIVVSFQYINGEPAMVLFPRHSLKAGAFIIPINVAWAYQENEHLVAKAAIAARVMGLGSDHATVYPVASVINNHLEELVKMKPEPEENQEAIGEGQMTLPNGTRFSFELR